MPRYLVGPERGAQASRRTAAALLVLVTCTLSLVAASCPAPRQDTTYLTVGGVWMLAAESLQ